MFKPGTRKTGDAKKSLFNVQVLYNNVSSIIDNHSDYDNKHITSLKTGLRMI